MANRKSQDNELRPPIWVAEAFEKLGHEYGYIAKFFVVGNQDFHSNAKIEIEAALTGIEDLVTGEYILTAHQQRVEFFRQAILHADYFRSKNVAATDGAGKPVTRHRAAEDFNDQIRQRSQIAETAKKLATLLRKHQLVTNRLGVLQLECDPMELIDTMGKRAQEVDKVGYLYGIRKTFRRILHRKGASGQPAAEMALLIDVLEGKARQEDNCIFPAAIVLGIDGHGSTHFFHSFGEWLGSNRVRAGGVIPDSFKPSDKCWAGIISALTGSQVDVKSIAESRRRFKGRVNSLPVTKFQSTLELEGMDRASILAMRLRDNNDDF
jgi:hypothetical protein